MRWKMIRPMIDDVKIKTKFLLFPKTLNGETRWLETVRIKYVFFYGSFDEYRWFEDSFVDEPRKSKNKKKSM